MQRRLGRMEVRREAAGMVVRSRWRPEVVPLVLSGVCLGAVAGLPLVFGGSPLLIAAGLPPLTIGAIAFGLHVAVEAPAAGGRHRRLWDRLVIPEEGDAAGPPAPIVVDGKPLPRSEIREVVVGHFVRGSRYVIHHRFPVFLVLSGAVVELVTYRRRGPAVALARELALATGAPSRSRETPRPEDPVMLLAIVVSITALVGLASAFAMPALDAAVAAKAGSPPPLGLDASTIIVVGTGALALALWAFRHLLPQVVRSRRDRLVARTFFGGTLGWALALVFASGCAGDGPSAREREQALLRAEEAVLARRPGRYRGHERGPGQPFRPTGGYVDGGVLWLFSADHREQLGVRRVGTGWAALPERRRGPRRTVACRAWGPPFGCLCLGRQEPGGILPCDVEGGRRFETDLPARGGFRDVAKGPEGSLLVLDGPEHAVSALGSDGRVRRRWQVDPGAQRIAFGGGVLWVASSNVPYLYGIDEAGERRRVPRDAPVRDLELDDAGKTLWVTGPVGRAVRRSRGPIEGLTSVLEGFAVDARRPVRRHQVDLGPARLVDASDLSIDAAGRVWFAATGSRAVGRFDPATGALTTHPVGLTPTALIPLADGAHAVPCRLDDAVAILPGTPDAGDPTGAGGVETLRLSAPPSAPSLATLGEVLFHDRVMWADTVDNDFTCQSCHWNGGSDHRMHPGVLERRWERTRSVAGVGMVAPVFTPMQAPTLAQAVEGFFETLDRRHWSEGRAPREVLTVRIAGRAFPLTPTTARRALLRYLMARPVERGPWRLISSGGGFGPAARRGARAFLTHCAPCHETTTDLRSRRRVTAEAFLATLRKRPLPLGAPLFVDAGIAARFTPAGHRVSPLIELFRGGPYFSDGSAPSLDAVLRRTDPSARMAHAPGHAEAPALDEDTRRNLRAFLLSL